jgi:hypothetical protein
LSGDVKGKERGRRLSAPQAHQRGTLVSRDMLADAFVDAFLPALAATLVGVGIGVPVALWIDRKSRSGSEAAAPLAREGALGRQRSMRSTRVVNANSKAVDELGLPRRETMTMVQRASGKHSRPT